MEIWLIDRRTRKRIRRLTLAEVLAMRALKRGRADAEEEALCRPLLDGAREHGLWFECGCRQVGSARPDFHGRHLGNGRYALANRPGAALAHAPDCVFRRSDADADRPPPAHHPDVLGGFGAAGEEHPPPDHSARPWAYWKPRPRTAAEQEKTLWGAASKLMQTARLNLLGPDEKYPPPEAWLAEIATAADGLYLPPRVPASGFLFTDPAAWRSGEVMARLEAAEAGWPEGGRPGAYLCWPVTEVRGREVDPGGAGHVEALSDVTCPTIGNNPVEGPYLFLGAVARSEDKWACVNACARPIAALDCPVPVDSGYERQAVFALWRLVRTLAGNRELGALLGGTLGIELEKPLTLIETVEGTCLPDFQLTVFRPGAYGHLPGGPGDPRHFGRFDPRDRARYVIEVMGFDDQEYERSKRRTHPRMARLGQLFRMEGKEFGPDGRGVDRQRRQITADIARDLLRRWRMQGDYPYYLTTASPLPISQG